MKSRQTRRQFINRTGIAAAARARAPAAARDPRAAAYAPPTPPTLGSVVGARVAYARGGGGGGGGAGRRRALVKRNLGNTH